MNGHGGKGDVRCERRAGTAWLTFDRPAARNAMTWAMYERLSVLLDQLAQEPDLRTVVLRGAGGSFMAGTDITQFTEFTSGDDALAYERRLETIVARIETLPAITLAVIDGWAAGAGLVIAAACDLRLCSADARFAMPIARTIGNTVSMASLARIMARLGVARTQTLLFTAGFLDAEAACHAGFVLDVVETGRIDARVHELCETIGALAPITLKVTKEAIRRTLAQPLTDDEDLIRLAYESDDFREGVGAFLAGRPPRWKGT